ncbi:MAG: Hfq protein [Clostridiales bacterium]|jgi:RNA chaperone Hfq|nr:Hfq protein [Clostridiales bacterium]MDN5282322.1 Hfq protein [Candidatus Ozemobacter sp.]
MSQYKSQVQNQFLSAARKKHLKVEVILETGTVLRGKIQAYDQFSISLSFKDKVEIVYKSSIIYISMMPQRPMAPRRGFGNRPQGGYSRPSYNSDRRRDDSSYSPPSRRPMPDFHDEPEFDDPPPPKKPPRKRS